MARNFLVASVLVVSSSASPITSSTTNDTSTYSFNDVRKKSSMFDEQETDNLDRPFRGSQLDSLLR